MQARSAPSCRSPGRRQQRAPTKRQFQLGPTADQRAARAARFHPQTLLLEASRDHPKEQAAPRKWLLRPDCSRMQIWPESSSQRRDRRRRGQDFDAAMRGSASGIDPPVEGECENPIGRDELRRTLLTEDDRSNRETFDLGSPGAAPLPGQTTIHLGGGRSASRCRLIRLVLLASTETAGSVSRGERHSVIEEEERRPRAGSVRARAASREIAVRR